MPQYLGLTCEPVRSHAGNMPHPSECTFIKVASGGPQAHALPELLVRYIHKPLLPEADTSHGKDLVVDEALDLEH